MPGKFADAHELASASQLHSRPSMPSTSPFAFLQPTARTIPSPPPPGGGLPLRTKVGPWRVVSGPHGLFDRTRYAVVHAATEQHAVLELFDVPALVVGSYTARIRDVIVAVARIGHAGVLKLYDCGTLADGRPYVVREAIDGYTLDELRADGPLPTRAAIHIVRGICEVIAAVQVAGVRHGVLDLEHVLARDIDQEIVLLDWRVADEIADEALRRAQLEMPWTSKARRSHSAADDVYDIGIILLQLIGDSVPPSLESLVMAMCAADPRARPRIDVVLARLSAANDELDVGFVWANELSRELRLARMFVSDRWLFSGLAAAAILIVFFMWRGDRPTVVAAHADPIAMTSAAGPSPSLPARIEPAKPPSKPVVMTAKATKPEPSRVAVTQTPKPAAPKAVRRSQPPPPPPSSPNAELLRQYQRVGRDLLTLEQQLGAARVADLRAEFRGIRINGAMAVAGSHQDAALTLRGLGQRIERLRPIQVSDACRNNPLATECQ